ncbi:transcriptional regulator GutM [Liquorilactobacillus mali]|uniref:transcriptional regulator GutM n=1 Tax=Liquorilactobacillus mali TaxID=1618 RepID=UPI002953B1F8|nr:transcriptional regulator GutM [Liquorilactobacillus mali]MDV7758812.1 transcriptional regulator [Liquorilactobacillus mali]
MLIYFGIILVVAFLIQGLLGLKQIKDFSTTFHQLRLLAPVAIGKNPKKFQSGTLILIAVKEDGSIAEARMMKGITIFAKFKELKSLRGENIAEVAASFEQLKQFDKLTRVCFLDAYKNYVNYKANKLRPHDFDSTVKIWSLPMVEKIKATYYKVVSRLKNKEMN